MEFLFKYLPSLILEHMALPSWTHASPNKLKSFLGLSLNPSQNPFFLRAIMESLAMLLLTL
jgi:hypothetical protein